MSKRKPATPRVLMYVFPEFKKKLKKRAIDTGVTTIDYTKQIAESMDAIADIETQIREKQKKFRDFGRIL